MTMISPKLYMSDKFNEILLKYEYLLEIVTQYKEYVIS